MFMLCNRRRGNVAIMVLLLSLLSVGAIMSASLQFIGGKAGSGIPMDWFGVLPAGEQFSGDMGVDAAVSALILRGAASPSGQSVILNQEEEIVAGVTKSMSARLAECLLMAGCETGKEYGRLFQGFRCGGYQFLVPVYARQISGGYGTSAILAVGAEESLDDLWDLVKKRL